MNKVAINGRFLNQPVTGVQRYAREIVRTISNLLEADANLRHQYSFEILAPTGTKAGETFPHLPVRIVGRLTGHLWEQVELPGHLNGAILLNFANTAPLRTRRQIVTIHDASVFAAPAGYSPAFLIWYRYLHRRLAKSALNIVTDSEFSRRELQKYCGLELSRSTVIPLGAEHVYKSPADESILARHELAPGRFVLAAGSLNPNKNLASLSQTARRLAERGISLVIAGGGNARVFQSSNLDFPPSVQFLGYVTDAELRALYEQACCFVFPSRYEGFGLPPLEAMACGCPVVVSNAASLPEVCGEAAVYVDPSNPMEIATAVIRVSETPALRLSLQERGREHAETFRWYNAANQWVDLLEKAQ